MRIASMTTGTHTVTHDGVTYEAGEDGIFEVPEHVGLELTDFANWLPEYEADAQAAAEQAERDTDVQRQADRIAALEADVAELREQLAALVPAEPDKPDTKTKTTK